MSPPVLVTVVIGADRLRFRITRDVAEVLEEPAKGSTGNDREIRLPTAPGTPFAIRADVHLGPPSP
jgi:hypothetical protein